MNKGEWFREAKYGLFIHWGLYAVPGGEWKGTILPAGCEWIMQKCRIPLKQYREFMNGFTADQFDAAELVRKAKEEFGFRYLCITAKHHDGFALYDSAVSDYNVMNTPCGRDLIRELSEACAAAGLPFCLYYSQMQDWAEQNGWGNDWDFGPDGEKDLREYLETKVKPQLRELLTGYGNISMIWFDTPLSMPRDMCEELAKFVRALQPDCLINGRIGYRLGDITEMRDRGIPHSMLEGLWETPMTLNDTWGYSRFDERFKSAAEVIRLLTDIVGKGGNLLLNIGPDASGTVAASAQQILGEVGAWLKVNGESIYGCDPMPDFPYEIPFGYFTCRKAERKIYIHILRYPERAPFKLYFAGLSSRVRRAYLLKTGEELSFRQIYEPAREEERLHVFLPEKASDALDTVVVLEIEGDPEVQKLVPAGL